MTITFSAPTTVKADCQAALTGTFDPVKTVTGHHGDQVTWNLVNNKCKAYDSAKVNLHFMSHVMQGGNNLGAGSNAVTIVDYIDDKNHVPNHSMHTYTIEFDHKDAGDPEIDVNDCSPPPLER